MCMRTCLTNITVMTKARVRVRLPKASPAFTDKRCGVMPILVVRWWRAGIKFSRTYVTVKYDPYGAVMHALSSGSKTI